MSGPARVEWLQRAIIYEVFPRNFSPAGDLAGVRLALPEIADLGATIVWLMPIHPIGERERKGTLGSPYAVRDHRAVHPDYGTIADLRALVDEAHRLGLRVLLDWVANHAAWDHVQVDAHPEWFGRGPDGQLKAARSAWKDVVAFEHGNPALRRYLIDSMLYWIQEADVDGFRCDVAGLVPLESWLEVRDALVQARPDVGLLAEAYRPELMERAFDLFYDNALYRAIRDIIRTAATSDAFWAARSRFLTEFPAGSERMTFIENHDQRRATTFFGQPAALAAAVLLLTFEGAPLIHNGQENGTEAPTRAPALFERHPISESLPHPEFKAAYRTLARLRRSARALVAGQTRPFDTRGTRIVAFARVLGTEAFVVAVNLSPEPAHLDLAGTCTTPGRLRPVLSRGATFLCEPAPALSLDAWGYLVAQAQG